MLISWKVSQEPAEGRLAISASAPAFSALTNWLLLLAFSAMLPLPRSTRSNCSPVPTLDLLAISGEPLGAVTYRLLALERRLIVGVPDVPVRTRRASTMPTAVALLTILIVCWPLDSPDLLKTTCWACLAPETYRFTLACRALSI